MRRLAALLLALVTMLGLAVVVAPGASAATKNTVTVHKIATKTAAYHGTAKVKPTVSHTGRVVVKSSRLRITHGSKVVAKNVASARLKAGTYTVRTTVTYRTYVVKHGHRTYSASHHKTRTQKLVVHAGHPSHMDPGSSWNCPSWAPIKGNASSMIYHVPGGAFYTRTNPEECFATRAAAVHAGYRASKR